MLRVLTVVGLLCVSGLTLYGQEPDKKRVESAIAEFSKYFANQNPHVRRAAADTLAQVDHPDLLKPILSSIAGEKETEVRAALMRALKAQKSPGTVAEMVKLLQLSNNEADRLIILEAFTDSRPEKAWETVLKLVELKSFELRYRATEVLGYLKQVDPRGEKALLALSADPEVQIRLVALEGLARQKLAAAAPRCIEIVEKDPEWRVRASAIAALKNFRVKESVQPLINLLKNADEGRLQDDALVALRALTGFEYGGDPKVWQGWWDRVKEGYKVPTELELKDQKKLAEKALDAYGKKDRGYGPTYHGIQTRSRRVMYIVDVSGSMADRVTMESKDPKRIEEFKKRYGNWECKIDLAREELIQSVASLPTYTKFNIVTFHSDVKLWKPNLVSASDGNKNDAYKYLSKLTPEFCKDIANQEGKGRTNTFDALNVALGLGKKPNDKPSKDHVVESDTVFFLSDGMPTAGRITDPAELVRYFNAVNARAKIVFHTVTFGHGNEALLQPLADNSGGKYLVIEI